jgi:hypothetical protein
VLNRQSVSVLISSPQLDYKKKLSKIQPDKTNVNGSVAKLLKTNRFNCIKAEVFGLSTHHAVKVCFTSWRVETDLLDKGKRVKRKYNLC